MTVKKAPLPEDFIVPLYMNGIQGRMLRMPSRNKYKREILLLAGHHTSIERMFSFGLLLNDYGSVTLPDFPGFGGMQSFYTIGENPTIDNLADYLAAFVKLRYKNQRFTIMAMSLAFVVTTRMLQKYPELAKKVDLIISLVGFAHKDDFNLKKFDFLLLNYTAWFFSKRLPAAFVQHVLLKGSVIKFAYWFGEKIDKQAKFLDADTAERKKRIDFEIILWKINDIRSHGFTAVAMFNLVPSKEHINLPVHHIAINTDRYFDNTRVEQSMRMIYSDFYSYESFLPHHAPSVLATKEEAAPFMPPGIRKLLRKKA